MSENQYQAKIVRPSFVDYFLGLAVLASKRSHDMQTQHGCVITDKNNRILSIGYNGFARGMRDEELPNLRPKKYTWMLHAERNALANCVIRPDGGTAYVTGQCCLDCGMALWEHGIQKIYMIDGHGTLLYDDIMKANWNTFIEHTGIEIIRIKPDLNWASLAFNNFQ